MYRSEQQQRGSEHADGHGLALVTANQPHEAEGDDGQHQGLEQSPHSHGRGVVEEREQPYGGHGAHSEPVDRLDRRTELTEVGPGLFELVGQRRPGVSGRQAPEDGVPVAGPGDRQDQSGPTNQGRNHHPPADAANRQRQQMAGRASKEHGQNPAGPLENSDKAEGGGRRQDRPGQFQGDVPLGGPTAARKPGKRSWAVLSECRCRLACRRVGPRYSPAC